jgi:hypothetical protein
MQQTRWNQKHMGVPKTGVNSLGQLFGQALTRVPAHQWLAWFKHIRSIKAFYTALSPAPQAVPYITRWDKHGPTPKQCVRKLRQTWS